jgi:hypothetical protein
MLHIQQVSAIPVLSGGPRVSKLGLKGLSDYHSNEMAVEAARRETSGPNKRATLTKHLFKRESWATAYQNKGQKAARQRKNTTVKKQELLPLTAGDACRWEMLKSMRMMMCENQLSQSQVHVTAFRGTEGLDAKKPV